MNPGIRRITACIANSANLASARNISSNTTHSMSTLKVKDDMVIANGEAMANIRKSFHEKRYFNTIWETQIYPNVNFYPR